MIKQYGHATWAVVGAFAGGLIAGAFQLGPWTVAVGVVVGALFGVALRG
jgi:uncharacterized protein YqgC (DUF456 family)